MKKEPKKEYDNPEIVYESVITTRAGSPTGDVADPANLFGKGD